MNEQAGAAAEQLPWRVEAGVIERPQHLRVALVAPPWFDVPPATSGGIESVIADFPAAVAAAGDLRPEDCSEHVAHSFDVAAMAAHYEQVYADAVAGAAPRWLGASEGG